MRVESGPSLSHARVLLEIGERFDAEHKVAEVLDEEPQNTAALRLMAKIKHMRGELSQAITCWVQMYADSPQAKSATMYLRSLLHVAMDPERNAGEFLTTGHEFAESPNARLQLERAFDLLLQRRWRDAMAVCDALALRHKSRNERVFKVAILASAWIAELSGEPQLAIRILERLGDERGFATDVDRVVALARVYQIAGTRENLESALHICRYLSESTDNGTEHLSEIALLYRRLGDEEKAERYERQYLVAFRRDMNRPSFQEVVDVAARAYVPLRQLLKIKHLDTKLDDGDYRALGIADALRGDRMGARSALTRGDDVLDAKYQADLIWLGGDPNAGVAAYLDVLRRDPRELRFIAWLLDYHRKSPTPQIAEFFTETDAATTAREVIEAAIERAPLRPSLWRQSATLLKMQPNLQEQARQHEELAAAHQGAHDSKDRVIGRVLSAAVYNILGTQHGLIHEMWASRIPAQRGLGGTLPPDQIHGNLSDDMRRGVGNIFLSVLEYVQAKLPHLSREVFDYNYTYKVTKEDERSHGESAGLPTAVAFLSVFIQEPVPQDVALTGVLVAEAHDVMTVGRVGDTEFKIRAAYNRNLRKIFLPQGNRDELRANPRIPPHILAEVSAFVANLDEVVRGVFGERLFLPGRPQ